MAFNLNLDRWVINLAALILIIVMAIIAIVDAVSTSFNGSETIILTLGGVFGSILATLGKGNGKSN